MLLDLLHHPNVQLEELSLGGPACQVNNKRKLVSLQHHRQYLQKNTCQRSVAFNTYPFTKRGTVLSEIFVQVLFPLNFAVGVGPHKLSVRNFLRMRKF